VNLKTKKVEKLPKKRRS